MICSVFIATSLDGFIARRDGSIDWLNAANSSIPTDEDCGYGRFISTVDALVMGRNTFEQVRSFPIWPYGSKRVVVLSRTLTSLPPDVPATVELSREDPRALVNRLADLHHLYVDGGLTIQSFLAAGLINEITITVIPVLLGSGRSLFGALAQDVQLHLIHSHSYDFGFVQNKYRVQRSR